MAADHGSTYEFTVDDVTFREHDGHALLARLYRPKGEGPFPAVADVHGGAWNAGDYLNDAPVCERLAAAGIVSFSIDFRQPPECVYPDSIADVHAGIRWLKAHAEECGTSVSMIGGLGMSSGGHQVMLCAMAPQDTRYAKYPIEGAESFDARLRFVVLTYPIVDPLARYQMAKANPGDEHYVHLAQQHDRFWPSEADMEEGNPQLMLERGEKVELPPILILQGTGDNNVTPDMQDRFVASYRSAGGSAELEKYEGAPHGFVRAEPESPAGKAAIERARAFILKHTQ